MNRKNALTNVTSQITEITAKGKNVYAVVMPQLTKILKNATLIQTTQFNKVAAAHDFVSKNNLPLLMALEVIKRTSNEDVNGANRNVKMSGGKQGGGGGPNKEGKKTRQLLNTSKRLLRISSVSSNQIKQSNTR